MSHYQNSHKNNIPNVETEADTIPCTHTYVYNI
jgi:hypothetical protein